MSELTLSDYKVLHEFRFQISRFLHFSEQAARTEGLEPRQHQFMLAVRAHDGDPTVGELAERLFIRHHSAVELADRLVERGLAERVRSRRDRRVVRIRLTTQGKEKLYRLSGAHREELATAGPVLSAALHDVLDTLSENHDEIQNPDLI